MRPGTALVMATLAIAVAASAYMYIQTERLMEIQRTELYFTTKGIEAWNEYTTWEMENWETATPYEHQLKWSEHLGKMRQMDHDYLTAMGNLVYP